MSASTSCSRSAPGSARRYSPTAAAVRPGVQRTRADSAHHVVSPREQGCDEMSPKKARGPGHSNPATHLEVCYYNNVLVIFHFKGNMSLHSSSPETVSVPATC